MTIHSVIKEQADNHAFEKLEALPTHLDDIGQIPNAWKMETVHGIFLPCYTYFINLSLTEEVEQIFL